jgi:molybdopterin synthase catalytic subunit
MYAVRALIEDVPVTVRLFAGCASARAPRGSRSTASTGRRRLGGSGSAREPGLLYAVNREYAGRERAPRGDRSALIPPVSGGAFRISAEPLDLRRAVAEAASDDAGAVATFVGTCAGARGGRALPQWAGHSRRWRNRCSVRLADELKAKHGLCEVAIHHRIGRVEIGRPSVVIAVSTRRTAEAPLEACRGDRHAQETIPLWKKERSTQAGRMDRERILMDRSATRSRSTRRARCPLARKAPPPACGGDRRRSSRSAFIFVKFLRLLHLRRGVLAVVQERTSRSGSC